MDKKVVARVAPAGGIAAGRAESEMHNPGPDRRGFLRGVAAGIAAASTASLPPVAHAAGLVPEASTTSSDTQRIKASEKIRTDMAKLASRRPQPDHLTNGEEALYPNRIASYSKGLPHNSLGEVDPNAYNALLKAMSSGVPADFEAIPLGLGRRLTNPQSALAFDLEGADSHHMAIRPAPAIAGGEAASELDELYWMALMRDVHFSDYASVPTAAAAAAELSGFADFRGPRAGGAVTPATLFRGNTAGDLAGPWLSQFLWLDIPMGAVLIPQRMKTCVAGDDHMTNFSDWLAIQNGASASANTFDSTPRYIRNLRDLAEWVHVDALYQAYHQACLILLGMGAPFDAGNPYRNSVCQEGFGTFGGPHVLSLVTEVATRALKAVWYQKWGVHRRLRPEAYAGLVHLTKTGVASYPVSSQILNAGVLSRVFSATGAYLLPMAFPDGCPTHPSYGAGHATVAGACVTILKAWFDESFVLPNPVVPDSSGTSLIPYTGPSLTVGDELNKLASNIAIGRNGAGVHYRSDYSESIRLGEELALDILDEQKPTYNEPFTFHLTRFDGTTVAV